VVGQAIILAHWAQKVGGDCSPCSCSAVNDPTTVQVIGKTTGSPRVIGVEDTEDSKPKDGRH